LSVWLLEDAGGGAARGGSGEVVVWRKDLALLDCDFAVGQIDARAGGLECAGKKVRIPAVDKVAMGAKAGRIAKRPDKVVVDRNAGRNVLWMPGALQHDLWDADGV
jgi:hypothetical protein